MFHVIHTHKSSPRTSHMPHIRFASFGISSVRPLCFLPARKDQTKRSPMPRRASASAVLLASVGACLRHLPPSHHSSSITPAPILFTICTQKPRQPQTMYLICTHVVCTRAHKIQPKNHGEPYTLHSNLLKFPKFTRSPHSIPVDFR